MAKVILSNNSYSFIPSSQQVDFTNFQLNNGNFPFDFARLYGIINVTAGTIIYSTAGSSSGLSGTYSDPILSLVFDTTPMSSGDQLQIIYDAQNAASATYDGTGTQPILSTTDSITGREGLDINLLNSSFGGQLTLPLPSSTTSGYNAALSMGFINGGNLVAPNMDAMTNNLKVDIDNINSTTTLPVTITGSTGTISSSVDYWQGNAVSYISPLPFQLVSPSAGPSAYNAGATDNYTLRTATNNYTSAGNAIDYGNGQIGSGSQRMSLGDWVLTGSASVSAIVNNIITNSASSTEVTGYRYFSIQIVAGSLITGGTYIFEVSNDNSNWQPLPVSNQSLTTGVIITSAITATNSSFIYTGTLTGRYFRIRIVSTITGGSLQAFCRFSQVAPLANNVTISQGSASTVAPNIDVLGSAVSGSRYNQVEIDFYTAPSASLLTTTTSGTGSITQSAGQSLFSTGTGNTSSAKGVSVGIIQYRAGNEMYAYFSAAFVVSGSRNASSYQRVGIYDTNNGFFVGYNGLSFGITKRTGGVDTFTVQSSFNGDPLDASPSSKFTRNNIPEILNVANANLYRVRFAWLGSATILFDIFSPDGIWVNFHTIKQPNSALVPSLTIPNLPITLDCAKTASGVENLTIYTACWSGGTTSEFTKITDTLTDQSLAGLTRAVITGVTTGGGGGYVNCKVNPSGALVTATTVDSSALPTGAATEATLQTVVNDQYTTGQATLTAGNNLFLAAAGATSTDAINFKSGSAQIVTAATTGAIFFEQSSDNVNWQPMTVFRADLNPPPPLVAAISITAASQFIYHFAIKTRYIRCRISTILGATAQSFLRLSQESWAPIIPTVVNSSGTTLNATVAGSLTTVSTVSTVSSITTGTLATVSAVTSAALAAASVTDIASAAITTTTTSANIATTNIQSAAFRVAVTVTSGTGQTLDVSIEETYDGTTYYPIYFFPRITATGTYYAPPMKMSGIGIRYVRTVAGTTPSFTMSLARISRQVAADYYKVLLSRTIDPNTLNSTTDAYVAEGCDQFQLAVTMNAGGTAPIFKLQGSNDNLNWYDLPSMSLTATVGASTMIMSNGTSLPKFVRGITSTAGVGSSLYCLCITARGA